MDSTTLSDKVLVGPGPFGLRVTCTAPIAPGQALFRVTGRPVRRADKYSIQISAYAHLTPDGAPWSLVNHACRPNAAIHFETGELYALRPVAPGEELGWNYLTTEWELSCPFECGCGAAECEHTIRGFKYLSSDRRMALFPLLSPYLRSLALQRLPMPDLVTWDTNRTASS